MNRFKQLFLSLSLALMFCVGFLSTDSLTVYAYNETENFFPIVDSKSYLRIYQNDWQTSNFYTPTVKNNKYYYTNPYIENVFGFAWNISQNAPTDEPFRFPFNPDLYDYYFMGSFVSVANPDNNTISTYKPTSIVIRGYDHATDAVEYYPMNDVGFYDIDSGSYSGFGWYGKVDFSSRDNIGIYSIQWLNDKDGLGNKPANLILDMGILAVEKSSSQTATLNQILNQLQKMESSLAENIQNSSNAISSAIGQAGEKITGAIEDQYDMEENEDFDVSGIQSQVEEKLGVLNFTADTLSSFLDLFDASSVGDTKITFPSYTIDVQGQSYTVWNNIEFDFSFLEENFGILVTAVRTVTVLCVWLAVLSYLGKAKDQIIINRG